MQNGVVQVSVVAVVPTSNGAAVFLGNGQKVMVIHMEPNLGSVISMFINGIRKERPLTHDLIGLLLAAFGAKVDHVVINDCQQGIYFARLIISAENELHARKVVEIDARPSDSIALAIQQRAPIYVDKKVWDEADDMSDVLAKIGAQTQQEAGSEESEELGELGELQGLEDDDDADDDDDNEGSYEGGHGKEPPKG
jgi:bifunctional DNase/RNase